jgi:hypothetical protein
MQEASECPVKAFKALVHVTNIVRSSYQRVARAVTETPMRVRRLLQMRAWLTMAALCKNLLKLARKASKAEHCAGGVDSLLSCEQASVGIPL